MREEQDISDAAKIRKKEEEQLKQFEKELKKVLSDYRQTSLQPGGRGFEELIKELMESDGFKARILPKSIGGNEIADADILAIKESPLADEFTTALYIQVKHYSGESVNGIDQIIQFKNHVIENLNNESIRNINYVLISSGEFGKEAEDKAEKENIRLINGARLAEILFDKIDKLPEEIRYQLGFIKKYEHI